MATAAASAMAPRSFLVKRAAASSFLPLVASQMFSLKEEKKRFSVLNFVRMKFEHKLQNQEKIMVMVEWRTDVIKSLFLSAWLIGVRKSCTWIHTVPYSSFFLPVNAFGFGTVNKKQSYHQLVKSGEVVRYIIYLFFVPFSIISIYLLSGDDTNPSLLYSWQADTC